MESRSRSRRSARAACPTAFPASCCKAPGTYRLAFRMRSRSEPMYFMRFCEATPEMERAMNEWMIDFHQSSVAFEVR